MDLILFVLATIGLTNILIYGKIFDYPREALRTRLSEKVFAVLECYQCTGFWTGLLMGSLLLSSSLPTIFAAGCAGSFLSHFSALIVEYVETNSVISLPYSPEEDDFA